MEAGSTDLVDPGPGLRQLLLSREVASGLGPGRSRTPGATSGRCSEVGAHSRSSSQCINRLELAFRVAKGFFGALPLRLSTGILA
jgi:hypothetical protein